MLIGAMKRLIPVIAFIMALSLWCAGSVEVELDQIYKQNYRDSDISDLFTLNFRERGQKQQERRSKNMKIVKEE